MSPLAGVSLWVSPEGVSDRAVDWEGLDPAGAWSGDRLGGEGLPLGASAVGRSTVGSMLSSPRALATFGAVDGALSARGAGTTSEPCAAKSERREVTLSPSVATSLGSSPTRSGRACSRKRLKMSLARLVRSGSATKTSFLRQGRDARMETSSSFHVKLRVWADPPRRGKKGQRGVGRVTLLPTLLACYRCSWTGMALAVICTHLACRVPASVSGPWRAENAGLAQV